MLALSVVAEGVAYVQALNRSVVLLVAASLAFISGAFLLTGLMTPLTALLVAVGGVVFEYFWIPQANEHLFHSHLAIINLIVLALAIGLLGPGAFSLDARMFGRREITIPSNSRATRS